MHATKNGQPTLAINVPWSTIPPNSVEEIPDDEISDILVYSSRIGLLRAPHHKIDPFRSMHSNYPFHPHVAYEAGESVRIDVECQTP